MNHRVGAPLGGVLLAILALATQIMTGATVPHRFSVVSEPQRLVALGVICHAGASDAGDQPAPTKQHHAPCALCPFCLAVAGPVLLPSHPPDLPLPTAIPVARQALPTARAPPASPERTAYPRGPPVLA